MIFELNVSEIYTISGGQIPSFKNGWCNLEAMAVCYDVCNKNQTHSNPHGDLCKDNCRTTNCIRIIRI